MFPREALRTALTLVVLLAASAGAHAQLFRAYLSSTGSDANPCTIAAPCRLLPAALAAVADGGEIWMLNSANYNTATVNITKSVSILAIPGAVGSIVSTGGTDAININAGGVKVALRNLAIVRSGVSHVGIKFGNGAELKVADCVIADMALQGIAATAPGQVFVRDTVIRGSPGVGFLAGNGESTLDGVLIRANGEGIHATGSGRVAVSNSVVAGNITGIVASGIISGTVRVAIEKSVVADNQSGIRGTASADSANVEVTVSRSTVAHNTFVGIDANQSGAASVTIVSDENVLADNGFGFRFTGTPVIFTRSNNTLRFNETDVSGGTLTALAGQ